MDPPKFLLNPDGAPFVPNFRTSGRNAGEESIVDTVSSDSTNHESTGEREIFDPASKPCTHSVEKIEVSDEDSQRRIAPTSETRDHLPRHNTVGIENPEAKDDVPLYENVRPEKQDMEDSCQREIEHEIFDPASKPCTQCVEKLEVSDEGSQRRIAPTSEAKDNLPQYNMVGTEGWEANDNVPPDEKLRSKQQDMENTYQREIELLSSLFPKFALQSIMEVYNLCENDVAVAAIALEDLEGQELHDSAPSFSTAGHSPGTEGSST